MMKNYTAKTVQDAVNLACQELGVAIDELNYEVIKETKTFFTKKAEIECYTISMVQEYIEEYVRRFISEMGFEIETVSYLQDGRIYCNINTSNNSILIGKAGVILRAINFIVKNAVSTTYKKRIELSIDINGYKEDRYKKVSSMAKRFGKQVLRTKGDIFSVDDIRTKSAHDLYNICEQDYCPTMKTYHILRKKRGNPLRLE